MDNFEICLAKQASKFYTFWQIWIFFWQFLTILTIFKILTIAMTILETFDIWHTDYNSAFCRWRFHNIQIVTTLKYCLVNIYTFWQFWQLWKLSCKTSLSNLHTLTNLNFLLTIFDHFDNFYNFDNCNDYPGDLWHLTHCNVFKDWIEIKFDLDWHWNEKKN